MDLKSIKSKAQNKTQELLQQHGDKIERGVGKVETFAKKKTKNDKQDAKVGKVAGKIRKAVEDGKGAPGPAAPPAPPAG